MQAFLEHLRKDRLVAIDVVDNPDFVLSRVGAVEAPGILDQRAAPRDRHHEEERIQPGVVEAFADVATGRQEQALFAIGDRSQSFQDGPLLFDRTVPGRGADPPGADLTGLMVAAWRIRSQSWAVEEASREMVRGPYGFDRDRAAGLVDVLRGWAVASASANRAVRKPRQEFAPDTFWQDDGWDDWGRGDGDDRNDRDGW
jgi:hypothetical protein